MADYNVTSSDGTFTVNVQTGTINNTYDVPFIGQDAINYGDDLVAAQLRQLENFSNTTAPAFGTTRVKGQLWYDSTPVTGRLNIFDGASWDVIPLDIDVVHTSGAESIADVKTFTSAPVFSAAGAPITVNSNTVVANLNADFLDDLHASAFATSAQGALADTAEQALPLNAAGVGFVLSADLSNNYTWISPAVSAGQILVDITSTLDTTTNVLLAGDATSGILQDPLYASGLTYNAATSTLSTLNFVGTLTGTATSATSATSATTATNATNVTISSVDGVGGDTTMYPVLVAANTAISQLPHTDVAQLSYNASTGQLNAALFAGNGAAITNLNMSAGSHTGTLAVARGGTGVTTSTGSGSAFVLHTAPTFVTNITTPIVKNGATGPELQFNSGAAFRIVDETSANQSTGAEVVDAAGTFRPVGIAPSPQQDVTTATELLTQARASATLRCNSGSAQAVTTENSTGTAQTDIPDGTMWIVKAFGAGAVTIVEGTSVTLRWWDGAGGAPSTGTRTLARGGIATVQKIDDDEYDVWGVGLT